jgi:hypothetical protein
MGKRFVYLTVLALVACLLAGCSMGDMAAQRFKNKAGTATYDEMDEMYGQPYTVQKFPNDNIYIVVWTPWVRGTSGVTVTRPERGPLTGRKYMVTETVGETSAETLCLMGIFDYKTNIMIRAETCDIKKVNATLRKQDRMRRGE